MNITSTELNKLHETGFNRIKSNEPSYCINKGFYYHMDNRYRFTYRNDSSYIIPCECFYSNDFYEFKTNKFETVLVNLIS
jgi:hypothetical protein